MPNKASAVKALRQSRKRELRNKQIFSHLRDLFRNVRKSIEGNDISKAKEFGMQIIQTLDKATKKEIIKKNTASRKKSRLMKKLNALEAKQTG